MSRYESSGDWLFVKEATICTIFAMTDPFKVIPVIYTNLLSKLTNKSDEHLQV